MAERELRIKVYGRVQGVNFRYMVKRYCISEGINGYVTNKEDGSVEIATQGGEEKLKKLLEWIKSSPGFSKVEKIDTEWKKIGKKYNSFEIAYSDNFIIDKAKGIIALGKRILR
ncbi:MAG: acylphosphatase [Candidatus Pacearchaeota archaeon]